MRTLAAQSFIFAAVFAAALGFSASNANAQTTDAQPSPTPSAPAMRVYRDPVTGVLTTPPPDTRRAVEPSPPAPPPLVLEPNPNGGGKARLSDAYAHSLRATKDASGKTTLDCERGVDAHEK